MADQRTGAQIKDPRAPVFGADIATIMREVEKVPHIRGRMMDVVFNGTLTRTVKHGLGRRYMGALVLRQTAHHAHAISVLAPITLDASGIDSGSYIRLDAGVSGGQEYTGTVTIWVF